MTVIGGLAISSSSVYVTHQIYGLMLLVAGVFSIFLIRIIGAIDLLTINDEFRLRRKVEVLEIEKSRIDKLESKIQRLERRNR